ncbi:hypothetical protein LOTGIDRAFT_175258 [Lottia gigantea]|uniref:Uncharacterized protein n=1 Tax=Lottia gigantea TaxID=225164 RepID=V4AMW5_LOTGI|nr:hypothetical protein LOTGIDRAFT_175258 [Lottia gigantea]ESO94946.1 hypothetical protein LOTGIDRAFT_175258 [Lottia gigantea]
MATIILDNIKVHYPYSSQLLWSIVVHKSSHKPNLCGHSERSNLKHRWILEEKFSQINVPCTKIAFLEMNELGRQIHNKEKFHETRRNKSLVDATRVTGCDTEN